MTNAIARTPPLSDKRPYAQGWNDWLAFGDAANGIQPGEDGYEEYERGKREARDAFSTK